MGAAEFRMQIEEKTAFDAARAICQRHAKSFYFASKFLPGPKRDAAYAVYAFCRLMDDAVDESPDPHRELGAFLQTLDAVYAGEVPQQKNLEATHAVHAFVSTKDRYEIPKAYFVDLAEGCRMDLTVTRYATWPELEKYCYHVAGVVGLVMSCVFGLSRDSARAQAVQMGNAMQLTNILRDIKEDWARGRIYLPQEDLLRFGYTEDDLSRGVVNDAFVDLMKFEIARAKNLFNTGATGLQYLQGTSSRLTASAMAVIYSGILGAIEKQGYDVFSRRAGISKLQKVGRIPRAWKLARRRSDVALPNIFG